MIFLLVVSADILDILRHKPLKQAINKRTFHKLLLLFLMLLGFVGLIGRLFNLNFKYLTYLLFMCVLTFFIMVNFLLQHLTMQQKFMELSQFMLKLCIYFRIYQKTHLSVIETLKDAPKWIVDVFDQGLIVSADLYQLSDHYLMKSLVEIFDASETIGMLHADVQLKRLEYDIEVWMSQTRIHQKEAIKLLKRLMFLFVMGIGIAYVAQNMLATSTQIHTHVRYQWIVFTFLGMTLMGLLIACKRLTQPWILKDECL